MTMKRRCDYSPQRRTATVRFEAKRQSGTARRKVRQRTAASSAAGQRCSLHRTDGCVQKQGIGRRQCPVGAWSGRRRRATTAWLQQRKRATHTDVVVLLPWLLPAPTDHHTPSLYRTFLSFLQDHDGPKAAAVAWHGRDGGGAAVAMLTRHEVLSVCIVSVWHRVIDFCRGAPQHSRALAGCILVARHCKR